VQILTDIYIYPIKSTKSISLPSSFVDEQGLLFDRKYMLVDDQGEFITGRTHPQLTQINIEFSMSNLLVSAPNMNSLSITPNDFSDRVLNVKVWSDTVEGVHCHD